MFTAYCEFSIFLNSLKNILFGWYLWMMDDSSWFKILLNFIDSFHFHLFYCYKKNFSGHSDAYHYLLSLDKLLEVHQFDKRT